MIGQRVLIDGDPFVLTFPMRHEFLYFLHFLRAKHQDIFFSQKFQSLCIINTMEIIDKILFAYTVDQEHFRYQMVAILFKELLADHKTTPSLVASKEGDNTVFSVFPKLIPLTRQDQPFRLNDPDGTITTGGCFKLFIQQSYSIAASSTIQCDSVEKEALWGDQLPDRPSRQLDTMKWVVLDGLLYALSPGWKDTASGILTGCLWDYQGEFLYNQYSRYPRSN